LSDDELARLDELVAARGTTRSETVRAAILAGCDAPERMELTEALDLLDAKARSGNVTAIVKSVERLLAERRRGEEQPSPREDFGLRLVG
jgi:hypothetical protein